MYEAVYQTVPALAIIFAVFCFYLFGKELMIYLRHSVKVDAVCVNVYKTVGLCKVLARYTYLDKEYQAKSFDSREDVLVVGDTVPVWIDPRCPESFLLEHSAGTMVACLLFGLGCLVLPVLIWGFGL